jgi:hypothetical protein
LPDAPAEGTPARPILLPPETPEERRDRVLRQTRTLLESSSRRPAPSTEEKVPANYYGGIGGQMWFLPFADSATKDTPEISAAMRLMIRRSRKEARRRPGDCFPLLVLPDYGLHRFAEVPRDEVALAGAVNIYAVGVYLVFGSSSSQSISTSQPSPKIRTAHITTTSDSPKPIRLDTS